MRRGWTDFPGSCFNSGASGLVRRATFRCCGCRNRPRHTRGTLGEQVDSVSSPQLSVDSISCVCIIAPTVDKHCPRDWVSQEKMAPMLLEFAHRLPTSNGVSPASKASKARPGLREAVKHSWNLRRCPPRRGNVRRLMPASRVYLGRLNSALRSSHVQICTSAWR